MLNEAVLNDKYDKAKTFFEEISSLEETSFSVLPDLKTATSYINEFLNNITSNLKKEKECEDFINALIVIEQYYFALGSTLSDSDMLDLIADFKKQY